MQLFILTVAATAPLRPAGLNEARAVFREAETLSRKDDGRLWKVYLRGPLLLIDPASGQAWANEEIADWSHAAQGVWQGALPEAAGRDVLSLAGRTWGILRLPLPEDGTARRSTIARVLFRRVEPKLGFASNRPPAAHLRSAEGLRWLALEAAALARALRGSKQEGKAALEDALVFRAWRRARFKPESAQERLLELNDGLAEYTAISLTTDSFASRRDYALGLLAGVSRETFARAFGLTYGILMDQQNKRWRDLLDSEVDLALVAREVWKLSPPLVSSGEAERRAGNYAK